MLIDVLAQDGPDSATGEVLRGRTNLRSHPATRTQRPTSASSSTGSGDRGSASAAAVTDRSRYPAHPRQAANARRRAERVLVGWGVEREAVEDVCVVVSELVTNAVVHARTPRGREVGVTLLLLDRVVRVEVRDADPTLLRPLPEHADGATFLGRGRGLVVVDCLCTGRWGSVAEVIGKAVWAEIPCEVAAVRESSASPSSAGDAYLRRPAEGLVNFSSRMPAPWPVVSSYEAVGVVPDGSSVVLYTCSVSQAAVNGLSVLGECAERAGWAVVGEVHDLAPLGVPRRRRLGWLSVERLLLRGSAAGLLAPAEQEIAWHRGDRSALWMWLLALPAFAAYPTGRMGGGGAVYAGAEMRDRGVGEGRHL
jgi:serine/threonine-protein kinase RsbW